VRQGTRAGAGLGNRVESGVEESSVEHSHHYPHTYLRTLSHPTYTLSHSGMVRRMEQWVRWPPTTAGPCTPSSQPRNETTVCTSRTEVLSMDSGCMERKNASQHFTVLTLSLLLLLLLLLSYTYFFSHKHPLSSLRYPFYGVDLDPRDVAPDKTTIVGWQWRHFGGTARRFGDNMCFFNGSVPTGMRYNTNASTNRGGHNVSAFQGVDHWTQDGAAGAIVHVFHPAFWGNWMYELAAFNASAATLAFGKGAFNTLCCTPVYI